MFGNSAMEWKKSCRNQNSDQGGRERMEQEVGGVGGVKDIG